MTTESKRKSNNVYAICAHHRRRAARIRARPSRVLRSALKSTYGLVTLMAVVALFAWVNSEARIEFPKIQSTSSAYVGPASVIDGDTLEIRGQRIRLFGIDAPESRQVCQDGSGRDYRCGQRATRALVDRIGNRTVSCNERDVDRYGRVVAVCVVGGEELNGWLVREGLAVAYQRFSTAYVAMEEAARRNKRDIWAGPFAQPEAWRRQH